MTQWEKLFGTPERAMQTIAAIGHKYPCDEGSDEQCCSINGKHCPFFDATSCRVNRDSPLDSPLLEWLESEVRDG